MAPRNKRPKGLRRIDAALDAMRPLGFPDHLVRTSVKELLKVYGEEGWAFIEDGAYRVLIEVMLSEQKESDHEHDDPGEKLAQECSGLQGNTECSEAGQCGDHDGVESINELEVPHNQMDNQGKGLDHTISSVVTDDMQQQHRGRVLFGFAPTRFSLPRTDSVSFGFAPAYAPPQTDSASSKRRRKPCYGWISDDDDEDEEDNIDNTI
ncbi:PREDICTED: uncharacterized protein LOC109186664 isoform X2 [Ipomoea nil]|uniref:uncharacterized protein LOC109186664 isoform X2 n=1 Tax=Ipomoea nil TaxID=35883 RepID=UPI0009016EC3|nr:PREDICTED: uncharacterized protein LOC109186664 isoform X2 [Ipomoea nil]